MVTHFDEPPYDPDYDRPAEPSRLPAADRAAEQALLTTLLHHPETGAHLATLIDETDLYWPVHQTIWHTWHTLAADGTPPDPIVLNHTLLQAKHTDAVRLLADLTAGDTTTSPHRADQHAKIVRDLARLRAVTDVATHLTQLAQTGRAGDIEHALGEALQTLDTATMRFGATNPTGANTGLADLTWITTGDGPPTQPPPVYARRTDGTALFYAGVVNGVFGDPEHGKAQPYDAEIQTPTGPRLMGDLAVGDQILGADGHAQTVDAIYEQGELEVWQVTTNDGITIEACADHLWTVQDHNDRRRGDRWRTLTTAELAQAGIRQPHGRPRWHLPSTGVSSYTNQPPLPLDPDLLGILLGDGHLGRQIRISTADPEILRAAVDLSPGPIRPSGQTTYDVALVTDRGQPNPLLTAIRALGLAGTRSETKFIPAAYLTAPAPDRLELLRGLMDTDGGMEGNQATYCTVSPDLAADVARLTHSLGGTARTSWTPSHLNGVRHRDRARIKVKLPLGTNPFRLPRKATAYAAHDTRRPPSRTIRDIQPTGRTAPMRCIAVSNPDRLYLTNGHVPTHNTWLAQIALIEALNNGDNAAMIDVDHNGPDHTAARLLLLGAHPQHLADPNRFRYYEPDDPDQLLNAVTDITHWAPAVTVLDSLGEIFPMLGVSTNDGDEMTTAMRKVCTPPAQAGSCVITIDHLPKNTDARATGFAIGSIAKKRAIRGAYIRAEARQKPAPGAIGRITLRIEKDTPGELRRTSGGGYAGTLTLDSTHPHTTTWTIGRDELPKNSDGTFRPTNYMEKVATYVADNEGCSQRDIETGIPGTAKHIRAALQILVNEGHVTRQPGPRRSWLHTLAIPYREAEDDQAQDTL